MPYATPAPSSMVLSYNGFRHPLGEPNVRFDYQAVMNEGEQIVAYKVRVDIMGKIITRDGTQASITAQMAALNQAYSQNGGDLILYDNAGNPTPNQLLSANCIGGTRVIRSPSWPDGGQAQYATQRDYVIGIEGEVPTTTGQFALWSFEEQVTVEGGGPSWDYLEPVAGFPQRQDFKENVAYKYTQHGRAVGYLAYPTVPPPTYPQYFQQYLSMMPTFGSPRRTGSGAQTAYKLFPVTYSYRFKSDVPLVFLPNFWPI